MEAKEEVRARLAIEDVIGEYVQLKRSGRLWRGLSPFTHEKTPSFFVTPDKNIWHDFSANKGGDVFEFVMEMEGLNFHGALELLARKAGVELAKYSGNPRNADRKKRYLEANIWAKKYFQSALTKSQAAQTYIFKKRKLSKDTVVEWGIGYAPAEAGLNKFLLGKKFTEAELKGAGLMSGSGFDMFRNRMMLPLSDNQGQIVGFTGRIIGNSEPKYLNTPATLLYDKGRQVFGLHLAKESIRKNNQAILVEGNLDVISSHQAGVRNVVACAGTALTLDHLKSLSRLCNNIILGFDSDKAGLTATERAIILAQNLDINLYVIELPDDAKDPDELIQKDVGLWQAVIRQPKSAVQWVIDFHASQVDLKTADGKKALTTAAGRIIRQLRDPVEAEHYINVLAELTDTSRDGLLRKITSGAASQPAPLKRSKIIKTQQIQRHNKQTLLNRILAIALIQKTLRSILHNLPNEYLTEPLAKVKYHLLDEKSIELEPELANKLAELELIARQIKGDKRILMLNYLKELELIEAEKRRVKLMNEFANTDDEDDKRAEIINGAIKGLNGTIKLLKKTGEGDEFEGLFTVWRERKDESVL
jgi:DNA primase